MPRRLAIALAATLLATTYASTQVKPVKASPQAVPQVSGNFLEQTGAQPHFARFNKMPAELTAAMRASTTTGATNKNDHSVVSPKLEHVTTNESEILEIAVNTDLPNSVFAPAFPIGSIIGGHDGKNYEVIADGTEQLYVAKAKGLRGAVFGFHLLWIAIGSTWLLRRKVGH